MYRKTKIQNKLNKAIENDLMEVYYQPKINLKDEKLVGIEALLRWKDEGLGTISPGEFIPIAEETGIIQGYYYSKPLCVHDFENYIMKREKKFNIS